jgi:hypothetical protein
MTGHGAKFGRKQEEAIAALLIQKNIPDAADAVGVATKTLLRWLQNPEFRAAYLAARREVVSQVIARLQQASGAAGATVLKLMTDANVPAAVRFRAAECVLDRAVKGVEQEDIEARLAALERAAETSKGSGGRRPR